MRTLPTDAVDTAISEVKKPDSYYLVECKKPQTITDDRLVYIVKWIGKVLEEYAECHRRHNALVAQIQGSKENAED